MEITRNSATPSALAKSGLSTPKAAVGAVELFGELAAHFRSLVEFPEAALEGLTDEQYVRSALGVIYGGNRSKPFPALRVYDDHTKSHRENAPDL